MPDNSASPGSNPQPRRATIVAAGLLLAALALVVLYTSRRAFLSPVALVVVAAIGVAALLLQLRLRPDLSSSVQAARVPLGRRFGSTHLAWFSRSSPYSPMSFASMRRIW